MNLLLDLLFGSFQGILTDVIVAFLTIPASVIGDVLTTLITNLTGAA